MKEYLTDDIERAVEDMRHELSFGKPVTLKSGQVVRSEDADKLENMPIWSTCFRETGEEFENRLTAAQALQMVAGYVKEDEANGLAADQDEYEVYINY